MEFMNIEKRREELIDPISAFLQKGSMSMVEAQKLRGRMQFIMDGQLFGRLVRLCMRAITDHAFGNKKLRLDDMTSERCEGFLFFSSMPSPEYSTSILGMPGSFH